jgi:PAS domain S-box-containing protein
MGNSNKERLTGKNWFENFIPEAMREEIRQVFAQCMDGEVEPVEYYENPIVRCDGEQRLIFWRNTVLRDDAGTVIGTLSSGEDITAKRRAEEEKRRLEIQIRQAQKLEAIGTLAGGIAHEINNPVGIIINYAQLMMNRIDHQDPLHGFAREIINESQRISATVKNLLSFARQDREIRAPERIVDIVGSTSTMINTFSSVDGIKFDVDIPETLPPIMCRGRQIQQVLMNLVSNARDAVCSKYHKSDETKRIRITADALVKNEKPWVRIIIEDNGSGIAPEHIEKVFDPFFTTKHDEQGSGLGLSVSYGIVQEHLGALRVESQPGEYTRLLLDLPAGE